MTNYRGLAEAVDAFSRGLTRCTRPEDRTLVAFYLSELAPLLARAALGKDILRELEGVERMFGISWLIDIEPFADALEKWRRFKVDYEKSVLAAMTANERLHALGILDAFDQARASGDRDGARVLLQKVHLDSKAMDEILSTF